MVSAERTTQRALTQCETDLLHRLQLLHNLPHADQVQVRLPVPPVCGTLSLTAAGRSRATNDPAVDTFHVEYLVGPCAIVALIFNYRL